MERTKVSRTWTIVGETQLGSKNNRAPQKLNFLMLSSVMDSIDTFA